MTTKKIYKPKTDAEFLNQLAFIRFVSGFRYGIVDERWPDIRKAFHQFSIPKVATAKPATILKTKNMIKNSRKIDDIITNAKICKEIAKEHGSVLKWVDGIKKEQKKDPLLGPVLEEEFQRFKGIGKVTAGWITTLHMAKGDHLTYDLPG